LQVLVVWIHKHELVIIGHVVILLDSLVLLNDVESDGVLLHDELWVLVD
jgi:hypothetical protein